MDLDADVIPDDIQALKAALIEARAGRAASEARTAQVEAEFAASKAAHSDREALILHLQLEIEKLKRRLYGVKAERGARLVLDQMELQLEELIASASEDELAAERAAARTTTVSTFKRKRPSRQPFPDHLPRERIVVAGPTQCQCCGGERLRLLGETITETLEVVPRTWKVLQYVREKFTCRDCCQWRLKPPQNGRSKIPHFGRSKNPQLSRPAARRGAITQRRASPPSAPPRFSRAL